MKVQWQVTLDTATDDKFVGRLAKRYLERAGEMKARHRGHSGQII